jgi:hypothetical protein
MAISSLEGVESLRIVRADGHLTIAGADRPAVEIDSSVAPRVTRTGGIAELVLRANATITVPAGVTVEVEELAGHLEVSDLATPLVVTRVRGNMQARRVGAVSIRETVSGNLSINQAGAVEGLKVRGALSVESVEAVTFSLVAGGFEGRAIAGEVAIEKIAGGAWVHGLRGPFIARVVGGGLELEDAADAEAGVVGGKVRAANLSGAIRIGKIGGKLAADNIAGDVAVGVVGGRARISRVGGSLSLEEVGGAIDLAGPYPADKTWSARSRGGRINVEVDPNASLEIDAAAGWGRIRTYGVEAAGLEWLGRHHVHGKIGPEPVAGARTKLAVETRGADVIIASADARERDFSGRGHRSRMGDAFATPFEDLAEEIGEEIPTFVRSVLDAAGKFVAESGGLSSGIVREVTRDVKRSVSQGLREVERAVGEIESAPGDVGEKLGQLGKEIGDLVANAVRGGSRDARHEMRERVRQAAREMRDKIRDAAREMRTRSHDEPGKTAPADTQASTGKPAAEGHAAPFAPGATEKLSRDDAILEILAAVKDGRLEPDEADDLINAWMEVSRTADGGR